MRYYYISAYSSQLKSSRSANLVERGQIFGYKYYIVLCYLAFVYYVLKIIELRKNSSIAYIILYKMIVTVNTNS